MISRAERTGLRRWASDDEMPPEMCVARRDILTLLDALDAADALWAAIVDHRNHACDIPHVALDAALARYEAAVEVKYG